jgi:hypothetical protein
VLQLNYNTDTPLAKARGIPHSSSKLAQPGLHKC